MGTRAKERTWTVGELAQDLGVTTRTLRFYEAEGLIAPERAGGNRVYGPRDHARMRLILRGRRFGMTLAECREIVDMYDGAASSEQRQLTTLLARLDEIAEDLRRRQADLRRTLSEVTDVATQCRDRLAQLYSGTAANAAGPASTPLPGRRESTGRASRGSPGEDGVSRGSTAR